MPTEAAPETQDKPYVEPWDRVLVPASGRFVCAVCQAEIAHHGICKSCSEAEAERAHEPILAPARATIPGHFSWAKFDHPDLVASEHGKGKMPHLADPIRQIKALFGRRLPIGLALVGEGQLGKSTLACAMLHRIHDSAPWNAPTAVVERARRAYFVSWPDLKDELDQWKRGTPHPAIVSRARNASVLVLDNVDASRFEDASARLLFARFNAQLPTIITTWMSVDEAEKSYGGGWARRAYERVVEVKR